MFYKHDENTRQNTKFFMTNIFVNFECIWSLLLYAKVKNSWLVYSSITINCHCFINMTNILAKIRNLHDEYIRPLKMHIITVLHALWIYSSTDKLLLTSIFVNQTAYGHYFIRMSFILVRTQFCIINIFVNLNCILTLFYRIICHFRVFESIRKILYDEYIRQSQLFD